VVIMTSNIGGQWIQELGEEDEKEMERRVLEALRAHFRPEFLNRIDEVIIFHRLGKEEIKKIVEIQLEHLKNRLAARKIRIFLTEEAKELLAKEGFDPIYGARPLKRTIQRLVQDPLALKVIEGEFNPGDSITVDADEGGKIIFKATKSLKEGEVSSNP